jgi:hypothetical protein
MAGTLKKIKTALKNPKAIGTKVEAMLAPYRLVHERFMFDNQKEKEDLVRDISAVLEGHEKTLLKDILPSDLATARQEANTRVEQAMASNDIPAYRQAIEDLRQANTDLVNFLKDQKASLAAVKQPGYETRSKLKFVNDSLSQLKSPVSKLDKVTQLIERNADRWTALHNLAWTLSSEMSPLRTAREFVELKELRDEKQIRRALSRKQEDRLKQLEDKLESFHQRARTVHLVGAPVDSVTAEPAIVFIPSHLMSGELASLHKRLLQKQEKAQKLRATQLLAGSLPPAAAIPLINYIFELSKPAPGLPPTGGGLPGDISKEGIGLPKDISLEGLNKWLTTNADKIAEAGAYGAVGVAVALAVQRLGKKKVSELRDVESLQTEIKDLLDKKGYRAAVDEHEYWKELPQAERTERIQKQLDRLPVDSTALSDEQKSNWKRVAAETAKMAAVDESLTRVNTLHAVKKPAWIHADESGLLMHYKPVEPRQPRKTFGGTGYFERRREEKRRTARTGTLPESGLGRVFRGLARLRRH